MIMVKKRKINKKNIFFAVFFILIITFLLGIITFSKLATRSTVSIESQAAAPRSCEDIKSQRKCNAGFFDRSGDYIRCMWNRKNGCVDYKFSSYGNGEGRYCSSYSKRECSSAIGKDGPCTWYKDKCIVKPSTADNNLENTYVNCSSRNKSNCTSGYAASQKCIGRYDKNRNFLRCECKIQDANCR